MQTRFQGLGAISTVLLLLVCGCDFSEALNQVIPPQCQLNITAAPANPHLGILSTDLGSDKIAQSIVPLTTVQIDSLQLLLGKSENSLSPLGGRITMTIERDSSGGPDGDPLASAQVAVASISTTTLTYSTFTLSTSVTLTSNTRYWVVLDASYNPSENYLVYWLSSNSNTYRNGGAHFLDRSTGTWETNSQKKILNLINRDFLLKYGCP